MHVCSYVARQQGSVVAAAEIVARAADNLRKLSGNSSDVSAANAAASIRDSDAPAPNISNEIAAAFAPPMNRVPVLSLPVKQALAPEGSGSSRLHR